MRKNSVYQSDAAAALRLSAEQREAAVELKQQRPEVYPDTRAIVDRQAALDWYDKVCEAGFALDIHKDKEKIRAFCDLAGVPD